MAEVSDRSQNWIPAMLAALLLGIGLHDLYRFCPNLFTSIISPVNHSAWEQIKMVFWPVLAVELGCFPPKHRSSGLLALVLVSTAALVCSWIYHLEISGTDLAAELGIFGVCILGYFLLSEGVRVPQRFRPLLLVITAALVGLITVFTLYPPHGGLFLS